MGIMLPWLKGCSCKCFFFIIPRLFPHQFDQQMRTLHTQIVHFCKNQSTGPSTSLPFLPEEWQPFIVTHAVPPTLTHGSLSTTTTAVCNKTPKLEWRNNFFSWIYIQKMKEKLGVHVSSYICKSVRFPGVDCRFGIHVRNKSLRYLR